MSHNKVDDQYYAEIRNMGFGYTGLLHGPHALSGLDEPATDYGFSGRMVNTYQAPDEGPPPATVAGTVIFNVSL